MDVDTDGGRHARAHGALGIRCGSDGSLQRREVRLEEIHWRPGTSGRGTAVRHQESYMKIKLTTIYVDNLDKALTFYTDVLGLAKKTDFSKGPYRWLTVGSTDEPDGTQLHLELNSNPAAAAYQQAMFQQNQPAIMFNTDDVKGDY